MPMIDVYATVGTFKDPKSLARDLAETLMKIEQVPNIPMFRNNTAAFIHDLPDGALSNVEGDGNYVRVQVLTNAGALNPREAACCCPQVHRPGRGCGRRSLNYGEDLGAPFRGDRRRVGPCGARQHQCGASRRRPRADRRAAKGERRWRLRRGHQSAFD